MYIPLSVICWFLKYYCRNLMQWQLFSIMYTITDCALTWWRYLRIEIFPQSEMRPRQLPPIPLHCGRIYWYFLLTEFIEAPAGCLAATHYFFIRDANKHFTNHDWIDNDSSYPTVALFNAKWKCFTRLSFLQPLRYDILINEKSMLNDLCSYV